MTFKELKIGDKFKALNINHGQQVICMKINKIGWFNTIVLINYLSYDTSDSLLNNNLIGIRDHVSVAKV